MKISVHQLFILLCFIVILSGCSTDSYLIKREKEFGTSSTKKWVFHRLSDRDKGTTLAFPGYIVGIEKSKRKNIGAPKKKELREKNALKQFGFNGANSWDSIPRRKRVILNDPKSMFLSSIHQFTSEEKPLDRIAISTLYDAYDTLQLTKADMAYELGFKVLDDFKTMLTEHLKKQDITHVFLFSMGWNSDQQEAIRNFNSLFSKIASQANESNKVFRPLFIGITWPSMWNTKVTNITSFFNKTNDADEIGMTWANYLLNRVILSKEHQHEFKTVVLGHSFGAKLTSRATMSASMLEEDSNPVDLLVNLQSAYSINRYSRTKGVEPTDDYVNWNEYSKSIALICSKNDKAVKAGFYAPFAGGSKSFKKVKKDKKNHYSGISTISYQGGLLESQKIENKLSLIDASEIIKRAAYKKGGGAHSDIYNEEVANLVWDLIVSTTY